MSNDDHAISGSAPGDRQILDPIEIRVLAVLAEKEALTPDSYPLSLNAIVNGCNQLSSRDPVVSLDDDVVLDALQRLIQKKLVAEVSQAGARVPKYEHRMRIKWSLEQDRLSVLTLLMLRGTQTPGEIRARSGRMSEFASVGDVENGLQFLIDKYPPLVARLPRMPGTKESRYMHLLGGDEVPQESEPAVAVRSAGTSGAISREDRIGQLEQEVAQLRDQLTTLSRQFEEFKRQFD